MPPVCAVLSCNNKSLINTKQNSNISYHKFPKIPYLIEKWTEATGRINWIPPSTSVICSAHFADECYMQCTNRRALFKGSIPTLRLKPTLEVQAATLQPKRESDYQVSDSSEFHSEDEIKKEPLAGPSRLPEQPDEIALFAKSVEDKLRKLNEDNRVIAKHQINDILMRLEMEQASSIEVKVESDDEDVLD